MLKQRGFTLIELLVVIAIIGILSSIIVGGLNSAKQSGRDARRVSDIKNIQLSLALYYNDNGHYPCSLTGTGYTLPSSCYPDFTPTYMAVVPKDPSNSAINYSYTALNTNSSVNCTGANLAVHYHLAAVMEATGSLLLQDRDETAASITTPPYGVCTGSTAKFDGNATNCVGTTPAGTDNCYDVVPNF
jgi:type IV pilus assembly protein PilE